MEQDGAYSDAIQRLGMKALSWELGGELLITQR